MAHKSSFIEKSLHFQTAKIYDFLPHPLKNIENHIIILKALLKNIILYSVKPIL
jgi:hypothetical protein